MKYIHCDICDNKIEYWGDVYHVSRKWFDACRDMRYEKLDICQDCMDLIQTLRRKAITDAKK